MRYRFSIITVCFNSEKTIEWTIKSLLAQSYENYEYIIVDGGSTDSTMEIVNKYKDEFNNIQIISEPDKGIYDAMNKGIKICRGELIGFLNSDDYYEPNALEQINDNYAKDIDIIYGDTYFIDKYKDKIFEKKTEVYFIDEIKQGRMIPHTSAFVKGELMKKNLFDIEYKIVADYKFMLQLYLMDKNFSYIPYRINNMCIGGASTTQAKELLTEYAKCQKELLGQSIQNKIQIKLTCLKMKLKKDIALKVLKDKTYIKFKYINKGWKVINWGEKW